jgi:hypothetical protein
VVVPQAVVVMVRAAQATMGVILGQAKGTGAAVRVEVAAVADDNNSAARPRRYRVSRVCPSLSVKERLGGFPSCNSTTVCGSGVEM